MARLVEAVTLTLILSRAGGDREKAGEGLRAPCAGLATSPPSPLRDGEGRSVSCESGSPSRIGKGLGVRYFRRFASRSTAFRTFSRAGGDRAGEGLGARGARLRTSPPTPLRFGEGRSVRCESASRVGKELGVRRRFASGSTSRARLRERTSPSARASVARARADGGR